MSHTGKARKGFRRVTRDGKVIGFISKKKFKRFKKTSSRAKRVSKLIETQRLKGEVQPIKKFVKETREQQLKRLIISKVVTKEGRGEFQRELKQLQREKILGKKVTRLEQIQQSRLINRVQKDNTRKILKAIETGDKFLAPKKGTLTQQKLLSEIIKRELRNQQIKGEALAKSSEANILIKRFKQGRGTTKDFARAGKLKLISARDLAVIGVSRVATFGTRLITRPKETVTSQIKALKDPETLRLLAREIKQDPIGLAVEFATFSKTGGSLAKSLKRSPVGFFIQKELFIARTPKKFRSSTRKILESAIVQKNVNPTKIKNLTKIKFVKPKTLNAVEFRAVISALRSKKVDSVVFGSQSASVLSGRKTLTPKDIDIGTSDIGIFNQLFLNSLPKKIRNQYFLRGEKLFRKGQKGNLFDIKPLSRVRPDETLFTKKGFLPVSALQKKIIFPRAKGDIIPKSLLPQFKAKIVQGQLEIKTAKPVTVKGVEFVGFGEQTLRKGLGTLQVLLEKNVRRAKDPQSFLISLKVQKLSGQLSKAQLKKVNAGIRLLESKKFSKLLDGQVKGLSKDFPLVSKISGKKLRSINKQVVNKKVNQLVKVQKTNLIASKLPKLKSSVLPSILPKSRLPKSKLPSRLPKSKLSKLPKSKLGVSKLSQIPISKIPSLQPSKIQISKTPSRIPSKLIISKLPSVLPSKTPSKLPLSKLPLINFNKTKPQKNIRFPTIQNVKGKKTGYLIQVRRRGKFKSISPNVMSKSNAEKLGQFLTEHTITASYKIQKSSNLVNTKVKGLQDLKRKFRGAKRDKRIRVERRTFRIDTIGEIRGLRIAKLSKSIGLKSFRGSRKRNPLIPSFKTPKLKQLNIRGLKL